jgi:hypothetical protein
MPTKLRGLIHRPSGRSRPRIAWSRQSSDDSSSGPRKRFERTEWLTGLLFACIGVILLLGGHARGKAFGAEILTEAGYVMIGTVTVSLVYEYWLRPRHDRQILTLVEASVITHGPKYGLASFAERLDYRELFDSLAPGDELLWLDTYCPGREWVDSLGDAIRRGASVAMLAVRPASLTATFRGLEMTKSAPEDFRREVGGFIRLVRDVTNEMRTDGLSTTEGGGGTVPRGGHVPYLELRCYSNLPCVPMYIICRNGTPVAGWTSYFLAKGSYDTPHLKWVPALDGLLASFLQYFQQKWDDSADTPKQRELAARLAQEVTDLLGLAEPGAVRRDVHLSIALRDRLEMYGSPVYRADVTFGAVRVVPSGPLFVSFVRTLDDMRHEFAEPNCVARELVDVSPATWSRLVKATKEQSGGDMLTARLKCEGDATAAAVADVKCVEPGMREPVVRIMFAGRRDPSPDPVHLEVRCSFYVSALLSNFPVTFPAYYCLGRTNVAFSIRDPEIDPESLGAHVFFAGDALSRPIEEIDSDRDGGGHWICVKTGKDAILWPGSGVVFVWQRHGSADE